MVKGLIRQMASPKNALNSETSPKASYEGASTNPCVRDHLKVASECKKTISEREEDARMVAALAMEELANSSPGVDAAPGVSKGNILRAVLTGRSNCASVSTVSTDSSLSCDGENRALDKMNVNTVTDLNPEHTDRDLQCYESIGSCEIPKCRSNVKSTKSINSATSVPVIELNNELETRLAQRKQHVSEKQLGPIESEDKPHQPIGLSVAASRPNCIRRQKGSKAKGDDETTCGKKQHKMFTHQKHGLGLVPINMSGKVAAPVPGAVQMMTGLGMVLPVHLPIATHHGLGLPPFTCASNVGLYKNGTSTTTVTASSAPVASQKALVYSNHLPPKKRKVNHIIDDPGGSGNIIGSLSGKDITGRSGIERKTSNLEDGRTNDSNKKSNKVKHSAGANTSSTFVNPEVNLQVRFMQELQMVGQQDEDGDLPLHVAVAQEDVRMVDQILHVMEVAGVAVDTYNKLKQTSLHVAIITKQSEIVKRLLLKKASPNVQDRHGNTSFHLAVRYNSIECLELLLNCNTARKDVDARNYDGFTALHMAVQRNSQRMVSILLERGVDIDVVDGKSGRTALFHAVELNLVCMVEYLLKHDADFSLQNYSGVMPVQAASGRKNTDIVTLLVKSGADACFPSKRDDTFQPQKPGQASTPNTPTAIQSREVFNNIFSSHGMKMAAKTNKADKMVNPTSPGDAKSNGSPWHSACSSPATPGLSSDLAGVSGGPSQQQRTSLVSQMQIPALPQLRTAADSGSGSGSDGDLTDTLTNNKDQPPQVLQHLKEGPGVSPICRNAEELCGTLPKTPTPPVLLQPSCPDNEQTIQKDCKKKPKRQKNNKPYARKHPHTVASLLDMVSTPASRDGLGTATPENSDRARAMMPNSSFINNHPVQFSNSTVTTTAAPVPSVMQAGHTHMVPPMGTFPFGLPQMMLPMGQPPMNMRSPIPNYCTPRMPMPFPPSIGMVNFIGHNNDTKKRKKSKKKKVPTATLR